MFDRLSRSWELIKQSARVLRADKELLLFPLFSGIACLVVLLSFALPLWGTGLLEGLEEGKGGDNPLIYVVAFLFYFCNYAVIIYFNSALIACAIIRFKGGDPTLGDGIRAANAALPQILAWAVVAATVGLILKIIESANERAGQFVAGLLGMAWSAVTYFVVPSLVVARLGPIEAFKRSAAMLKRTWGEALTANFGIGLIFLIIFLFALIPFVAAMALIGAGVNAGSTVLVVLGVLAAVVIVVTVSLISSALSTILQAAVYLYAAEGVVPQEMDGHMLRDAFSTPAR